MAKQPTSCVPARPDPRALWDQVASQFSATVLGGSDIIPESNEWYVTSLLYAMQEQFYAYAAQLATESDPHTACCDNLLAMAADFGMYPKPASFAEGYVLVQGVPNAALVDPLEMSFAGNDFRSVGQVPARLNSEGAATVRFRALEPGPASNIPNGQTGSLTNAPAGVNREVTILGASFCGGSVEETCEQFRQRYIDRLSFRPKATQQWVIDTLMEWPCVTRVCPRAGNCCDPDAGDCCPDNCSENLGNEFYVFMDNTFECGVPPECVVQEIEDWMFGPSPMKGRGLGQAPIGVCGALVVPTVAKFNLSVDSHECLTPSQQSAIDTALRGYMLQLCPSNDIDYQQLIVIVGQVLGPLAKFDVHAVRLDTNVTIDTCGVRVPCDVMPCLQSIIFTSPTELGPCANG